MQNCTFRALCTINITILLQVEQSLLGHIQGTRKFVRYLDDIFYMNEIEAGVFHETLNVPMRTIIVCCFLHRCT